MTKNDVKGLSAEELVFIQSMIGSEHHHWTDRQVSLLLIAIEELQRERDETNTKLWSANWKADGYDEIARQAETGSLTCEHVAKAYVDNHYAYHSYEQNRAYEIARLTQVIKRARLDGALPIRARAEFAEAEVSRLRKALEPFAAHLTEWEALFGPATGRIMTITVPVSDFRNAKSALSPPGGTAE